jgi:hypothetical protein
MSSIFDYVIHFHVRAPRRTKKRMRRAGFAPDSKRLWRKPGADTSGYVYGLYVEGVTP